MALEERFAQERGAPTALVLCFPFTFRNLARGSHKTQEKSGHVRATAPHSRTEGGGTQLLPPLLKFRGHSL